MRIFDIKSAWVNGTAQIRAQVLPDSCREPLELWYHFEGLDGPLETDADPFVAAMLPSCMLDNEPCIVDGHVSKTFFDNLPWAQNVLDDWYPFLKPVTVEARRHHIPRFDADAAGVGCCFSGDVDSWYSFLENRPQVTHLLTVRGFDIGLDNDTLWRSTRASVGAGARATGKRLITCETNLRHIADRGRAHWSPAYDGDFWGMCLHGAALASCAQPLRNTIGRIIVPSTHSFHQLKPWGSSPRLDGFWSNDGLDVIHDGCEADRLEKIRRIAANDLALRSLRVCHNDTGEANCGRCEKCVRTMLELYVCGALGRAAAFRNHDPFRKLQRLEVPEHLLPHYQALLRAAYRIGAPDVVRSLETVMGMRFSVERTLAMAVRRARRAQAAYRQSSRVADTHGKRSFVA